MFLLTGSVAGGGALCQGAHLGQQEKSATVSDSGIDAQVAALSDGDATRRAAAACALGKMGTRAAAAVPALIRLLDDGTRIDPKQVCVRGANDDHSGQADMDSLKEPSPGEAAAEALIAIGHPSVEPLIAALRSDSMRVRKNSAWALGQIRDSRSLLPLIEATKDGAWQVRAYAAAALGQQRDKRVIQPLVIALKDTDEHVRWFAAASLGNARDHDVIEPLIAALKDRNSRVRAYTAASLGVMKDERAVEPLIAALRDESAQVRMYASASLGSLGDARAVAPLTALLDDESHQVRTYARSSLNQIRH
jgi:HEAT repeat protein